MIFGAIAQRMILQRLPDLFVLQQLQNKCCWTHWFYNVCDFRWVNLLLPDPLPAAPCWFTHVSFASENDKPEKVCHYTQEDFE